jgi:hypothetical protein
LILHQRHMISSERRRRDIEDLIGGIRAARRLDKGPGLVDKIFTAFRPNTSTAAPVTPPAPPPMAAPPAPPIKIFINYRRADVDAWADGVSDQLKARLPDARVFMDIDGSIPLGRPWANWLDSQVADCDLMMVLIGRSWVEEFKARSDPSVPDYVRFEIESALKRNIPVVPVFLGDVPVPSAESLPVSIRPLLDLQATRLQRASFATDAKQLIAGSVLSIKLA